MNSISFPYKKNIKSSVLIVPPLSFLTSCTPAKSNFYHGNSLRTVVSEHHLFRFFIFQVPNLTSLFHCLGYSKGSVQSRDPCIRFVTRPVFKVRICYHLSQSPRWRTTLCQLSATTYSICSLLTSTMETVRPSAT